jgi:hypothetical protein
MEVGSETFAANAVGSKANAEGPTLQRLMMGIPLE